MRKPASTPRKHLGESRLRLGPEHAIRVAERIAAHAERIAAHAARASAAAAALSLLAAAPPARAEPARYTLDPEHTSIAFRVDHLGLAAVLGTFLEAEGSYRFDEDTGELSDLTVAVDTASVWTGHAERDEHLRSTDFLDVEQYPEMVFTADSARRVGDGTFEITGRLRLLGETRPLTLTATWNGSAEYPFGDEHYAMGVSARGSLARSDFGMTYGVGNGFVGDEVEILLELEARRE